MLKSSLELKLDKLSERQQEIHGLMSDPGIIKNQNGFRDLSKEAAEISPIVECYRRYRKNLETIEHAREMLRDSDSEIREMAEQEISVQDMAPAALINLVGSGEIPLSPTIFDANVTIAKRKGAPVEWRPLEPVVTTVGSAALLAKAPNPHTALLFIDYLLSKEGQQLIMKGGLWSPREDVGTIDQKFKKSYLDEKYSPEEIEAKYAQWETLLRQLFIRRK